MNSPAQLELPLGLTEAAPRHVEEITLGNATVAVRNFNWRKFRRRTIGTIHSLHPYPTRFNPDLPARLIEALSKPGQTVLDPFCGSGTAVFEATRRNRRAIGVDISPLAALITRTKCTRIQDEDQAAIQACVFLARSFVQGLAATSFMPADIGEPLDVTIREYCSTAGIHLETSIPDPKVLPKITRWFTAPVIFELSLIRAAIEQCRLPRARDLLLLSLSSVMMFFSCQRSDTRRSRVDRVFAFGETLDRWTRRVGENLELLRQEQQAFRWSEADVHCEDARDLSFLPADIVDLVVTSPPYPNSFDYRSFERLRLLFLGLQRRNHIADIGSPRISGRGYHSDIVTVLRSLKRVLKSTGLCAFVIGSSRVRGTAQDNARVIGRAAVAAGFDVICVDSGESSTTGKLCWRIANHACRERILLLKPKPKSVSVPIKE